VKLVVEDEERPEDESGDDAPEGLKREEQKGDMKFDLDLDR